MSIVANVGVLAFFKYFNFLNDQRPRVRRVLPWPSGPMPALNIILPIGLSFHTFQAMSYTIEVYRGQSAGRAASSAIFALYVMFYPQLVAGPDRAPAEPAPPVQGEARFDYERAESGLQLMAWGCSRRW